MVQLIILVWALFQCLIFANGQIPSIEFLETLAEAGGQDNGYLTENNIDPLPNFVKGWEKICVNGMYAMYSAPAYGGTDLKTTVIPIQGSSRKDCTMTSVATILRNVTSIRRIAGAAAGALVDTGVYNLATKMVTTFTEKYFLGAGTAAAAPTAAVYGSFTVVGYIGGFKVTNNAATPYCVCLDLGKKGRFMVPDTSVWPTKEEPLTSSPTITLAFMDLADAAAITSQCATCDIPSGYF